MMKNQFLVSQSERERTVRLLGYGKKALGAVLLVGLVLLGSMSYDGSRYGSSVGSSSGRDLLGIKTQVGLEGNRDGTEADRMNHVAVVLNPGEHILPPLYGKKYGAIAYVTSKLVNGQIPEVPKKHKGGICEVIAIKSQTSQSAASDDISTVYPAVPELTITDKNGYISEHYLSLLDDNADSYYIIKGDKPTDNAFMVDGDSNRFIIELQGRGFFAHNTVLTIIGGKDSTEDKDNIMAAAKLGYVARVYAKDGKGGNKFISYDILGRPTPANDVTTIYLLLISLREEKFLVDKEATECKDKMEEIKAQVQGLQTKFKDLLQHSLFL